jgi:hypothetical protein
MTNELLGWLDTVTGAVKQMEQWPVAVLLIAFLIVVGAMLKSLEVFPNRAIPTCLIVLGSVANAFLGNPGTVGPTQRHPIAVLALQGALLGFASIALHFLVLKRFEKYIPFLAGKSGDT